VDDPNITGSTSICKMFSYKQNVFTQLRQREGQVHHKIKLPQQTHITGAPPHSFRHNLAGNFGLVQRLKEDTTLEGHTGSVNTISWDEYGNFLVSGSDDSKIKIWDVSSKKKIAKSIISGHTGHILCTKFMPCSNNDTIISCGVDRQIRVTNLTRQRVRPFNCHSGRVKKLAYEPFNPSVFLSASEDGTVRQFDLRVKHKCGAYDIECDNVLVDLRRRRKRTWGGRSGTVSISAFTSTRVEVADIVINPRNVNQFVIGCGDPVVRVYDRRMLNPQPLQRFVPAKIRDSSIFPFRYHITGVAYNYDGTKILASYSGEHIYAFETNKHSYENTQEKETVSADSNKRKRPSEQSFEPSSSKRAKVSTENEKSEKTEGQEESKATNTEETNVDSTEEKKKANKKAEGDSFAAKLSSTLGRELRNLTMFLNSNSSRNNPNNPTNNPNGDNSDIPPSENNSSPGSANTDPTPTTSTPTSLPDLDELVEADIFDNDGVWIDTSMNDLETVDHTYLRKYSGHRNCLTLKEVNFFGPRSEYVVSGSDGSKIFIWEAETGKVVNMLSTDKDVVNCVQGHPSNMILATSGIESVIKLWTPTESSYIDHSKAEQVMEANRLQVKELMERKLQAPHVLINVMHVMESSPESGDVPTNPTRGSECYLQ